MAHGLEDYKPVAAPPEVDPPPSPGYSRAVQSLGNYVNGAFVPPSGEALVSHDPAADGAVVFETAWSVDAVAAATAAAAAAQPAWGRLTLAERFAVLTRWKDAIAARARDLADAIVLETGKLRSEAAQEVQTVLARFDVARGLAAADLREGPVAGSPHEQLRYHPLGVVAVIGPYNYPIHLCNAHVIPALLTGNAVVVKPSDLTPLAGQRYAEAAHAAGLPAGLFNLVQGTGAVGAALVADPRVKGLCFTGSYGVGRRIQEAALDRPELLLALEMGGKNTVVVLDDASIRQATHEIIVGGYLSAGQRCTATDRVLVHRKVAGPLLDALRAAVPTLRFGHPEDPSSFAGPLASAAARERFERHLAAGQAAGAEPIVPGGRLPGGFYRTASLHALPDGKHAAPGYTDAELFGPDLGLEIIDGDDEAIAIINASPYGFANAVFTSSSERFERIYRETTAGILNRNRSTNLASARLPFGGTGRSGNYRPAGSTAHRNVVVPVAVQDNVIGTIATHPMLADHLPAPDLDLLEQQHAAEDAAEAARTLIDDPRPLTLRRPRGGKLPTSDSWLIRLYAGDRVVKDKKPAVFDHLRSAGPWFVSIDNEPLSVLDAMSQTATVCAGFAEDPVVQTLVEGGFGDTLAHNDDTAVGETWAAAEYAATLRHLVPGLPHVTFTASGAEANEKALALCLLHRKRPAATRVLAFEGSFHGRTLLALHATHSPAKRAPFELAGHEATFAPFPVWNEPSDEPAAPSGFYAACAAADLAELAERFGAAKEDRLLAAEVASLAKVDAALRTGTYFAVIVEPMQSEGGDRYATERFFRALRLLTRHHDVPLVFDEVQVGFGLGGTFAWHERFRLLTQRGQPDHPDAVTFAKRAQVGVVMSRWDDPEPGSVHNASLVRGRLHAEMMSTSHAAARIEKLVAPRLDAIARAFPHLVSFPRACGYAFAFDLPSAAHLDAFIGQRFWRGAIVFAAGTRTARYRLSDSFLAREIDALFDAVRRSLSWLDAHPGQKPPEWEDIVEPAPVLPAAVPAGVSFRQVLHTEAMALLPAILDIEYQVYEPARRTPPAEIRAALEDAEGSVIIAEKPGEGDAGAQLVGFALGAPLEHAARVDGPADDPMLGKHNTMYSVSVTVAPGFQGSGIGRKLKELQLRDAAARVRDDGSPRYHHVTGRNRVGRTAQMTHLNRVFGAHVVSILTGQYEDPEGQAIYYRIPLRGHGPDAAAVAARAPVDAGAPLDAAGGLARVLAVAPRSLAEAVDSGLLSGPAVNKLTLVNYVTPLMVRALEWIGALAPDLPHIYLTSSRDETFDKAVRLLRIHRKQARIAIGLDGGYLGHTIGSTRSLSDPAVHRGGPGYFDWPRVPHPAVAGAAASLAALRAAVAAAGGSAHVLGFFYEVCQERTGRTLPADFLVGLAALRKELDLPLVAIEHTTASYRSGHGPFASPALGLRPDVLGWWGGAQTGYLHVGSRWFVATPMALVSTWDGDELSLVRNQHQLRAARQLDIAGAAAALDRALAGSRWPHAGLGLYRVIATESEADADALWAKAKDAGVLLRRFPGARLGVVPALDQAAAVAGRLAAVLEGRA
jgi:acyl-CoA reductase-like NAD-dependent aldehyde dehydrogenase/4-aminobutyrate aminotransferase-like enzyme/GNAT superfamily N-acetyltransferase